MVPFTMVLPSTDAWDAIHMDFSLDVMQHATYTTKRSDLGLTGRAGFPSVSTSFLFTSITSTGSTSKLGNPRVYLLELLKRSLWDCWKTQFFMPLGTVNRFWMLMILSPVMMGCQDCCLGASLVTQWYRIPLAMQETRV